MPTLLPRGFRLGTLSIFLASFLSLAGISSVALSAEFSAAETTWERRQALIAGSEFNGLEWRSIGPVVQGGRIVDIESVPGHPYTFYVAYASGGLWRTVNNGVTFDPLFDDQPTLIMGDIAVDPSNPRRIWVGTGENNSSRSSYGGQGVFRSDDEGETWSHAGLRDSDRIGRILVDPSNSERVFVAATGKLYTKGGRRGVFRTDDGGKSWQHVLDTGAKDGWTGVIDLAMDPTDPQILFAAAWERSRRPWNFVEAGSGSGIYKSMDGGDSWTRLSGGFPQGEQIGRIGLAISASNPNTLYAAVDNQELLPEEQWDLGDRAVTAKRLRKMTRQEFLEQDPEAIEDFIRNNDLDTELTAASLIEAVEKEEITLEDLLRELDDANANLFNTDIRGLEIYRSDDSGTTWRRTHDGPLRDIVYTYGYYFGQIRVAPNDPETVYCVGVPIVVSKDGGKTFSGINGRGVHVDYHEIWMDAEFPSRILAGNDGGLDMSYDGGKSWVKLDRQPVGQFYTVQVDMDDPYNVYGGLQDNGTLKGSSQSRPGIDTWTAIGGGDGMHVQIDPRDGTTYLGSQFGYYGRINADGSRDTVRPRDKLKEPALRYNWNTPVFLSEHNADIVYFGANRLFRSLDKGVTWAAISDDFSETDKSGDVPYGTVTTISESPLHFGRIWVGTDDGRLWLTTDGGESWKDVRGSLPKERWVSRVEASRTEKNRAYVSLNGYRDDDPSVYLYVTEDLGGSWNSIGDGLPSEPVNVVREDPVNPEVLYVGTDRGVYVSLDRGERWQALASGLPPVPVHDLVVHPRERELVAGTHGRSVYIADVLPVQELNDELRKQAVHLFPVEDLTYSRDWQGRESLWFDFPEDDPKLRIPFWSAKAGAGELQVLDDADRILRSIPLQTSAGINTVTWDLLLDPRLALDAESKRLISEAADKPKEKKGRKKQQAKTDNDGAAENDLKGRRSKTPWAEAARLDWPIYVTPGEYKLRVKLGEDQSEEDLTVESPKVREPRAEPKPKIRGRDEKK